MPVDTQPVAVDNKATSSRPRGRRWLLSALGGAVAGFTASRLASPADAEADDGAVIRFGESHSGRRTTSLTMEDQGDQVGLKVEHTAFADGFSLGTTGVLGIGQGIFGAGVAGRSNVTGVSGTGGSVGVEGTSARWGVRGVTTGSPTTPGLPAGGRFETFVSNSVGTHALVAKLSGEPDPVDSIALLAEAPAGNLAARFVGAVVFAGNLDLAGDVNLDGTLVARAAPGGMAARFEGPAEFAGDVVVGGSLTQSISPPGGGAAVPAFAVQALDAWMEDFGGAPMAGMAQIRVELRPEFLAVADVSEYHIFLTGVGGDTPQVSQKDETGFTVKALNANKAPQSISYRLVARRK